MFQQKTRAAAHDDPGIEEEPMSSKGAGIVGEAGTGPRAVQAYSVGKVAGMMFAIWVIDWRAVAVQLFHREGLSGVETCCC